MTQFLLSWLIVIAMGLFPMGINPSAHFLPTSHRQIFFAFSKTLFPLSHSAYSTNTCSHMLMTQRDGKTVCWRNKSTSRWIALQSRPWWQPIAQASVSKVLSQTSRSGSAWGGGMWRVPWGPSWRNSGASPLPRNFSTKRNRLICSFWLCLVARVQMGYLQISKNFPHVHHKIGF